ncbi:DUF4158 domain-containing protein [Spirillospora sp. CA-128828]|uniref:DUF4158 domain-containing protein n=1 Tax=Spirillospora sp. CA-128828 TaxID=3240033 RepID=UPI003D925E89
MEDVDRDLIAQRRTEHHQVGFALQMRTVRYVGVFLEDPLTGAVAGSRTPGRIGVEVPSMVMRYTERQPRPAPGGRP